MPLTDLLQWVDMARRSVVIEIERPAGFRPWLRTLDRDVVATSVPHATGLLAGDGTARAPGPGLRALCAEGVLDLFFETSGVFTVTEAAGEGVPATDAGVPLELPLGYLIMEGMRQLDDWPRLDRAYPDERARVTKRGEPSAATELGVVQRAMLEALAVPRGLGELGIVLGLSHRALLRRIDELALLRLVAIDGAPEPGTGGPGLSASLAEQARALVAERQFAEAAHVLRSLLLARPEDATLLRLLEETERRHVAACRDELPRSALVRAASAAARPRLSPAEQIVLDALTSKPRSVAGLVLGAPQRELETLVAILSLRKKGLVAIGEAD